jgi:hypothetical protein
MRIPAALAVYLQIGPKVCNREYYPVRIYFTTYIVRSRLLMRGKDSEDRGRMEVRALRVRMDPAQLARDAASVQQVQEPLLEPAAKTEEAEGHSQMTIVAMPIKDNTPDVEPLIPGEYYWVTRLVLPRAGEWFIAKYDPAQPGGWTNEDHWNDADQSVVAWRRIERP